MRDLERNKKTIWYVLYERKQDILDENGDSTGDSEIKYSNPVEFKINVSANKGESEIQAFGTSLDYSKVMSTHNMELPIDEYSRLYVDIVPVIQANGSTTTKPDYCVVKPAKSINNVLYAIKRLP